MLSLMRVRCIVRHHIYHLVYAFVPDTNMKILKHCVCFFIYATWHVRDMC